MTVKRAKGRTGRPVKVPGETPTKQKIFDSALDLFAERGFDRTSVRHIAAAAGITESAVYRHYSSKEAVLGAIFEYAEGKVYAPMPSNDVPSEVSGETLFRDMFRMPIRVLLSDPYIIKIIHVMFIEMYRNEGIRERLKLEYGERADSYTEMLFREYARRGTIRSDDPRALAVLFNRFRFAWMFQTFVMDARPTYDAEQLEKDLEGPIRMFVELTRP
jgi:AcrR family transcriptional regulator